MMKKLLIFLLLTIPCLATGSESIQPKELTLQNESGRLNWSEKGLTLAPAFDCPKILGDSQGVDWSILLIQAPVQAGKPSPGVRFESKDQTAVIQTVENGFAICYSELKLGKKSWRVSLKLIFRQVKKSFICSAEIVNSEKDWIVSELTGPVLKKLAFDISQHQIYWPFGVGRKIAKTPDDRTSLTEDYGKRWRKSHWGLELTARYPGTECTMQYVVIGGEKTSLYFGSPDASKTVKDFGLRYNPQTKFWSIFTRYFPLIQPKKTWKTDLFELMAYQGDWHAGADHYRQWFDCHFKRCDTPEWVHSLSGMLLYIMKQQKGRHLMWTYHDVGDSMSDLADEFGFDFIALFGWARGGHDHLYPEYFPDKKMGGAEVLKKSIAKAKARGKHVYLYANGQLMDQANTNFWNRLGKSIAIKHGDGTLQTEKWHKFADQEAFIHGVACSFDPRWFEIMLDLAKQANDLGADGILFDQLAVGSPSQCFSTDHQHAVPVFSRGFANADLLEKIHREMKKINPNFIILTEGWHDMACCGVPYFHASGIIRGAVPPEKIMIALAEKSKCEVTFPAMFRYTFPESEVTIRNPFPVEHPRYSNYACFYAFNHEIEIRYPTDVTTIRTKSNPTVESYKKDAVNGVGGLQGAIDALGKTTAQDCMIYTKKLIDFQRANSEFLLTGRFIDTCGFSFKGNVVAVGFDSKDKLGVLVWNPNANETAFELSVPNARAIRAAGPDEPTRSNDFFKPLAPNSLRLIVFEKNK